MDRVAFTRNTLRDFVSHLALRVCHDNIVRCGKEHIGNFTFCTERLTAARCAEDQAVRVFSCFRSAIIMLLDTAFRP